MTTTSPERFELRVLGVPDLTAPDGRRLTSVLSQPSRLSLLAYLALAPGPVTRAAVVADFWPESDEARARNALSQAVFYLRRSLGKGAVQSVEGDRLWVPPERVWCDARELLTADAPSEDVVRDAADELLAGWNADGSQPLQEWLDSTRRRVRARARELEGKRREREAAGAAGAGGLAEAAGAGGPSVQGHGIAAGTAVQAPGSGDASTTSDERSSPDSVGARARARLRIRWARLVGAAALVTLVLVAVLPLLGRPAEAERLAVLMPRVTPVAGAPSLNALTLNSEILARLPRRADLDVVPLGFATSLGEFLEGRDALDASSAEPPDWLVEVSVVLSGDQVHVVTLIYRGAGSSTPWGESFDVAYDRPEDLAVDVPRAIAERVTEAVSDVIGE